MRRPAQLLVYEVAYERTTMHADPSRETRTDPLCTVSDALPRKVSARTGIHTFMLVSEGRPTVRVSVPAATAADEVVVMTEPQQGKNQTDPKSSAQRLVGCLAFAAVLGQTASCGSGGSGAGSGSESSLAPVHGHYAPDIDPADSSGRWTTAIGRCLRARVIRDSSSSAPSTTTRRTSDTWHSADVRSSRCAVAAFLSGPGPQSARRSRLCVSQFQESLIGAAVDRWLSRASRRC